MGKRRDLVWCCTLGLVFLVACGPKSTGLPTSTPTVPAVMPTATPTVPAATPTPVTYVVQSGDSLSVIAARYGVDVELLAQANGISDPNVIKVGQVLVIPGPTPIPTATVLPTSSVRNTRSVMIR